VGKRVIYIYFDRIEEYLTEWGFSGMVLLARRQIEGRQACVNVEKELRLMKGKNF